jgi:hypothetical protein
LIGFDVVGVFGPLRDELGGQQESVIGVGDPKARVGRLIEDSTGQRRHPHALRSGLIQVTGPPALAKMLPTWNIRAARPWIDATTAA